jgi:hypothetical protein
VTEPTPPSETPASNEPAVGTGSKSRYFPDGSERPRFLLSFPSDPALNRLVQAFEAGDFAYVRKEAPRVALESENPEVRNAALELRRRIDPDRTVMILLGIAVLFFLLLVLWVYLGHGGHEG